MTDQLGVWTYKAEFSDGAPGVSGTFNCVESDLPGLVGEYEPNPIWFGFKGGGPLLRSKPFLTFGEVCRLGEDIRSLDVFGHALTVHNATGDDIYRSQPWFSFGTLQGPKTTNRQRLAEGLLQNHHPSHPLFAQETLWPGNTFGHPCYSDEDIRRNAFVILFCAAMINYGDMTSSSSSGFSHSMDPNDAVNSRQEIIHKVWDTFAVLPWPRMKPRPDLVNTGYCLADPGHRYLVYVEEPATIQVKIRPGTYEVEWINARQSSETHHEGETNNGRGLRPPGRGPWAKTRKTMSF